MGLGVAVDSSFEIHRASLSPVLCDSEEQREKRREKREEREKSREGEREHQTDELMDKITESNQQTK